MIHQVVLLLPHTFFSFALRHLRSFLLSGRFQLIVIITVFNDIVIFIAIIIDMLTTTTICRRNIMLLRTLLHHFLSRLVFSYFSFPHFPF